MRPQQPPNGVAVAALTRFRYALIGTWGVLTVLGAIFASRFTANTAIDFSVPKASLGYNASRAFEELFPQTDVKVTAVVRRVDGAAVLGSELRALTHDLAHWARGAGLDANASMVGYYTFEERGLPELTGPFVNEPSAPERSTASLIVVSLPTNASDALSTGLREHVHARAPSGLDVKLAGEPYFLQAALDGVTHDVEQVHPKVVPFAFIPFLYIVRSWRLALITLACIGATAGTSYFLMWPISELIFVANFAPSMMLSATLATSIDYSLFLLSRFREEILAHGAAPDTAAALAAALCYAGHTVLVSGVTLALCFFGLLFFPIGLISSLGLATGLTIVVSVAVNLTLLPALILAFPAFFSRIELCCRCGRRPADAGAAAAGGGGAADGGADSEMAAAAADEQGMSASLVRKDPTRVGSLPERAAPGTFWARLSTLALEYRWLVLVAFVAALLPSALQVAAIETSQSQQQTMPRDAEASIAYTEMVDAFGSGALFPFNVLIQPADGVVESADFFNRSRAYVRRALELANATESVNVTGVMMSGATDVPFELLHAALHADAAACAALEQLARRPVCTEARLAWRQFTNGDADAGVNASATYVSLALSYDAFSARATAWLKAVRAAFAQVEAEAGGTDTFGLVGGAIAMNDSVALVYEYFPLMVGITLSVVFVLFGAAFRSAVVPLRAVLTISGSLVLSMGCAWLVYGRGALAWTHWPSVPHAGNLSWSTPILSLPIMVGLACDYDIYLLGRILEFRQQGLSERESVAAGLESSGPLITAAGMIMAIAFGALLFSSSTSLNELAFLLTASVLIDALLVRTVLVPAAMGLLDRVNWWPRALPPPGPPIDLLPLPPVSAAFAAAEGATDGAAGESGLAVTHRVLAALGPTRPPAPRPTRHPPLHPLRRPGIGGAARVHRLGVDDGRRRAPVRACERDGRGGWPWPRLPAEQRALGCAMSEGPGRRQQPP